MSVEAPLIRDVLNGVLNSRIEGSQALSPFDNTKLTQREYNYYLSTGDFPVTNYSWEPGDIRRYGGVDGTDCIVAIQRAIETVGTAIIPENFTALVSTTIDITAAGVEIFGKSRFTSILQPVNGFSAASLISHILQASGSTYGNSVHDLFIKCFSPNNAQVNVIGVDLASQNNCTVRRCRFVGTFDAIYANMLATGVRYAAPLASAAYSNCVQDCDFTYLGFGVLVGDGANHNIVRGGEFISCQYGIYAAPPTATDTLYVDGPRFEGCDIGIFEGTQQATYLRCRFENNATADIKFNANSQDCVILGGLTAVTVTSLLNMSLATGLHIFAPDLYGMYSNSNSSSRPNELIGPNVMAPLNDTGTTVNPTGISSVSVYFRNGFPVLDNNLDLRSRNAAGTNGLFLIRGDASDRVFLGAGGEEARFGGAMTTLGGGAAPTLGTIGGTGPATAAQNSWKKFFDVNGIAFWVPVWR